MFRHILAVCLMGTALISGASPIRVLIVDGFSNHDWERNTRMIRSILEPTGLFTIAVATSPSSPGDPGWESWRPRFADYGVVIQTCNDLRNGMKWPEPVRRDLESYVENGGGVYIYHSGNNAFPNWKAYDAMIGLGWRNADSGISIAVEEGGVMRRISPGEGSSTHHGPRSTVLIKRLGNHPIHHGFPGEWLTPDLEVYRFPRGPAENLEILSCARDVSTSIDWPIEWVTTYGLGRVYTSTFGHVMKALRNPEGMRCAGFQTLLVRVLQWLAHREPDFPIPDDFPTAHDISIRPELEPPIQSSPSGSN